jgi:hypothetical protein
MTTILTVLLVWCGLSVLCACLWLAAIAIIGAALAEWYEREFPRRWLE